MRKGDLVDPISTTNSAALLILQQVAISSASAQNGTVDSPSARTIDPSKLVEVGLQPSPIEARIAGAMFSVNSNDVSKMKIDLIEKTGKALGVKEDDYDSREDFVAALQKSVMHLMLSDGPKALDALSKELGLDKLGITIDDVVQSARDPDKNDRVTQALEAYLGKIFDKDKSNLPLLPNPDGSYGLFGR